MAEQMDQSRVAALLYEVCVDLGFCLPPAVNARLESNPPADVDEFTDVIFREEGMEPYNDTVLRNQVRERVAKHFKKFLEVTDDGTEFLSAQAREMKRKHGQ
jgi:hypothetical protein